MPLQTDSTFNRIVFNSDTRHTAYIWMLPSRHAKITIGGVDFIVPDSEVTFKQDSWQWRGQPCLFTKQPMWKRIARGKEEYYDIDQATGEAKIVMQTVPRTIYVTETGLGFECTNCFSELVGTIKNANYQRTKAIPAAAMRDKYARFYAFVKKHGVKIMHPIASKSNTTIAVDTEGRPIVASTLFPNMGTRIYITAAELAGTYGVADRTLWQPALADIFYPPSLVSDATRCFLTNRGHA
jgi:hypothetical protein